MTVTKTRALVAALLLAASPLAVTAVHAQDRQIDDTGDGSRVQRKAAPAKQVPAGSISSAVGKPLGVAQKAMQEKKWPDALTAAKEALGVATTPYEKMKVNQFLTVIYSNTGDGAAADAAAEAAADTPADQIPTEDKQQIYYAGAALAFNNKHTEKAVAYAKELQALGTIDARTQGVVNQILSAAGDPSVAAAYQKEVNDAIAANKAPPRDALEHMLVTQINAKDEAAAEKTMITLLTYYDDKRFWKQIIDVTMTTRGLRDTDALMLGRLLFVSGSDVSKEDADLVGSLAQKQAIYGDAVKAQAKGATLQMDPARVARDKSEVPAQITLGASQNGVFNIKLAEALLGYDMFAQAETAARLAQTKGGADASEIALVIGIAQVQQGKYADAVATFGQVSGGGPVTPRVAELWTAYAKNKGGLVPHETAAAAPAAAAPAAAAR